MKFFTKSLCLLGVLSVSLLSSCASSNDIGDKTPTTLNISAAASLTEPLNDIKDLYIKNNNNIDIVYNFGGSGSLQQQIEQGAEVDIFFSAAPKQIEALKAKDLLLSDTITNLLENEIVLIAPINGVNITTFEEIKNSSIHKVALGETSSVPVGQYSLELLTKLNILDSINEKIVYAKDVKSVLTWVEEESAEVGIVYATDAKSSSKVKVLAIAPEGSHSKIIYPVAITKDSKNIDSSKDFLEFLNSKEAKDIFTKYGFITN